MLWQFSSKQQKPFSLVHLAPVVILLYGLGLLVQAEFLIASMGLLLWGFVPGFYLLRFLPFPKLGLAGELILSCVLSFVTVTLLLIVLRGPMPFILTPQVLLVTGLNAAIYVTYLLVRRQLKEGIRLITREDWIVLAIALLPLLMFIVRSLLNPYLVDQDGSTYVKVMDEISRAHQDISVLGARRAAFTNAVMSLGYMTRINYLELLKFVLPGFAWIVFGLPAAVISNLSKQKVLPLLALLMLSSASLLSEIDRIKPEIFVLLLWLPAVLCFFWGTTHRKVSLYVLGLAIAYLSFRSHDTGAITLLTYLMASVAFAALRFKEIQKFLTWKKTLWGGVIIFPYLLLFGVGSLFASFQETLANLPQTISGSHFHWWFLNSYNSGGIQAGWPGWTFIIFYVFNGFGAIILLGVALRQLRQKGGTSSALLLPLISLVVYGTLSEILPRFGIFFLPDRTWVHFFYDATIIILLIALTISKFTLPRWLQALAWVSIVGGVCISFLLSVTLGSVVSRSESGVIASIRSLPKGSLVLSTQAFNSILVDTYGDKEFISITLPGNLKDLAALRANIDQQIADNHIGHQVTNATITDHQLIETIIHSQENGILVTRETHVLSQDEQVTTDSHRDIGPSSSIYLLYSFAKTDGLQTKFGRGSWISGIDLPDRGLFAAIPSAQAAYRDPYSVLVKVR